MKNSKDNYKFTIAEDGKGNKMLSAFCDEIDPTAVNKAKYVSPTEFVKALVKLIDKAN